ncbi:MAG: cbb3-type cytochrome c oxidase subunit II [Thermoanaerobaculia bacterium]|nr:cbb3-type cytochrome c oxidase subunit II [Thermoanaerobaculia bacterium]
MFKKVDKSSALFVVAAVVFFWTGGLLTTLAPPMLDASWAKPAPGLKDYATLAGQGDEHARQIMAGRAIYVAEGCWYCHTQQTRTIEADTIRSGWRDVRSPVSTPDEFVYDQPHMFGTRRVGPDLSRIGGKYDGQWHATHFRDPRSLVPGSAMPPFPWIVADPVKLDALIAYLQSLGRAKDWRPEQDYEE